MLKKSVERPERTREHYIEAIGRNFIERFILIRGHTADEPKPDYGYDILMNTFDYHSDPEFTSGEIENGSIFIQLKSTDNLKVLADGQTISFSIKRRHAVFWINEPSPVFLVVYSVKENQAYWLHMQHYLKNFVLPPNTQEEFTVHLSKSSILDEQAIDQFRRIKAHAMSIIEGLNLYG